MHVYSDNECSKSVSELKANDEMKHVLHEL